MLLVCLQAQVQPLFSQFPLNCNVSRKLYKGWDTKIVAYRVSAGKWRQAVRRGLAAGLAAAVEHSGSRVCSSGEAAQQDARGRGRHADMRGSTPAPRPMPQAHFRVSRSAQHLISPDDAKAYYGPCSPPPAPCPRPRGFNLEADLFNITPYHRFESFYHYKGDSGAGVGGSRVYVGGWVGGGWRVCVGGGGGGGGGHWVQTAGGDV